MTPKLHGLETLKPNNLEGYNLFDLDRDATLEIFHKHSSGGSSSSAPSIAGTPGTAQEAPSSTGTPATAQETTSVDTAQETTSVDTAQEATSVEGTAETTQVPMIVAVTVETVQATASVESTTQQNALPAGKEQQVAEAKGTYNRAEKAAKR